MIKLYKDGTEFINENKEILESNINLNAFFFLDAPLLKKIDKINYALKCESDDDLLLILKVEPYSLMVFGSVMCVMETFEYLINNNYEIKNILCEEKLGIEIKNALLRYEINYEVAITMDFMECNKITLPTETNVKKADISNLDKLYEFNINFIKDCGLFDEIKKEDILKSITSYRYIEYNGQIVSMAKYCQSYFRYGRISNVYTLDEFRGKGFAKKVVNALKNEMINDGLIATLNVDRFNPISNHIYTELGFEKTFSQVLLNRK